MIGNDIVDLGLAGKQSNWKRPGFLEKIFTTNEQLLISKSENPEIMVWNLWSRKEAAYKIYNRQTGIRAFIPTQLECFYENDSFGSVRCNEAIYHTKTKILNEGLHSIAVTQKEHFDQVFLVSSETTIYKINRLPFLIDETTKQLNPVSISHHGRFSACVGIQKNYLMPNLDFNFKNSKAVL